MTQKYKPILFSTPVVKAILEGRKTQTRRVIKLQPVYKKQHGLRAVLSGLPPPLYPSEAPIKIGYMLWVRETWRVTEQSMSLSVRVQYKDGTEIWKEFSNIKRVIEAIDNRRRRWQSPRFMPREAARIFLEVKNVRCERLQDISEQDAKAEGVFRKPCVSTAMCGHDCDRCESAAPYTVLFKRLWDSLNAKSGYSWERNLWVWVYEFTRVEDRTNA